MLATLRTVASRNAVRPTLARALSTPAAEPPLVKTALYDLHLSLGGKVSS